MVYMELVSLYVEHVSSLPITTAKKQRLITAFANKVEELQSIEKQSIVHNMPLSKLI